MKKQSDFLFVIFYLLFVILIPFAVISCGGGDKTLIAAVGTTLVDSGFLDPLVKKFEADEHIKIKVIGMATGAALEMGRRGEADVLITHDPEHEAEFMVAGYGSARYPYIQNDFVIAGPKSDPAGIKGLGAIAAMKRLAGFAFASRNDQSGTHRKEIALFRAAGVTPTGRIEIGAGMGDCLRVADERQAYLLVDKETYGKLKSTVTLDALVSGDTALENKYSIIIVKPQDVTGGMRKQSAVNRFVKFLLDNMDKK